MTYLARAMATPRLSLFFITLPFIIIFSILMGITIYEANADQEMRHIINSDFGKLEQQIESSATNNYHSFMRAEAKAHLHHKLTASHYLFTAIGISIFSLVLAWLFTFSIFRKKNKSDGTELEELLYYNQVTEIHNRSTLAQKLPVAFMDIQKDRGAFTSQLENALKNEEFCLFYQPIMNTADGRIMGVEALLRWDHPDFGIVMPDAFLFLCENTGLIVPLGTWVLNTACMQLKKWHEMGHTHLDLSINLSARQINYPGLFESINSAIIKHSLSPKHIKLEITESLVMKDVEANITLLKALKNLGVQLALDDFGTGFTALSYLKQFPFNIIKIDKSFISGINSNITSLAIVESVVSLGKSLGLTIVAEGVEDQNQLHILKKIHCDLVQGYLFSKPIPAASLTDLLNQVKMS